jgi:hypothetical protein
MTCCAQAIAHPECSPDEYVSLDDAICPARTGKFHAVSHEAVGGFDTTAHSICSQHEPVSLSMSPRPSA